MKRVLFVDDEQKVLDGLKRMLYPMRAEWQMAFLTSGREALSLLSEADYDVLVTDLRMPEISGVELLSHTQQHYPQTARLVLSGTADQEIALRSATLIHQYLVKPCDAATLRTAISRALSLHGMLADPGLKQLVSSIESLPSVPAIYAKLLELFETPDVSPSDIGKVISQDMSMTAKVLQLVNSAFFGLRCHIANPTDAVIYLGEQTVRNLVLVASGFSVFRVKGVRHFSIESLQSHSMAVGAFAKEIADCLQLPRPVVDQVYVGGLLHAIGKLVLAANYPEEYDAVLRHSKETNIEERMSELAIFGTTHAEVGAYLLWRWGLPDAVTEIVLRHHESPVDLRSVPAAATIVHLADCLVKGGLEAESATKELAALGLADKLAPWKQANEKDSGT